MEQFVFVWMLVLITILVGMIFSKWAFGTVVSPVTAYAVPWGLMIGLYYVPGLPWRTLSLVDYWFVGVSFLSYMMGSGLVTILHRMHPNSTTCNFRWSKTRLRWTLMVLTAVSALGTAFYLEKVRAVVNRTQWDLGLLNAEMNSGELDSLGVIGRMIRLSGVAAAVIAVAWDDLSLREKRTYGTLAVLSVGINLLSTRRSVVFTLVTWITLIRLMRSGINWRSLIQLGMISIAGLVFFGTWQYLLNKGVSRAGLELVTSTLSNALIYVTGNLDTLKPLLESVHEYEYGLVTLYPVSVAISRVAPSIVERPDLSIPFSFGSIPFNTVPYLYYAYRDFGILGLLIVPYFVSIISTLMYTRYLRQRHPALLAGAALMMTATIYTIRENSFGSYDLWFWAIVTTLVIRSCVTRVCP